MQEWQQKLHDFSEKAEEAARNAAENDLDKAWTKAEAASRNLQAVGGEGWESAQASDEKASTNWRQLGTRFIPRTNKRDRGAAPQICRLSTSRQPVSNIGLGHAHDRAFASRKRFT